jgi:hypothetical protein
MTCHKCGGPLGAHAGAGRPSVYCSAGCRRAAEYERARIGAELAHLLTAKTDIKLAPDILGDREIALAEIDAIASDLEARLRLLLTE